MNENQQQKHNRDESLIDLFAVPSTAPTRRKSTDGDANEMQSRVGDKSAVAATVISKQAESKDDDDDDVLLRSYDDVHQARADIDAPQGSVSYMMGLFAPPSSAPSAPSAPTKQIDSDFNNNSRMEKTPLLSTTFDTHNGGSHADLTPKLRGNGHKTYYGGGEGSHNALPSYNSQQGGAATHHSRVSSMAHVMPSINESSPGQGQPSDNKHQKNKKSAAAMTIKIKTSIKAVAREAVNPTTAIGSIMFLLMHLVFCLAIGSAIIRPHSTKSILGLMTKTAALGIIFSSPVYWVCLSTEIPSLYPTVDLFLAPFLANLASIVDETLYNDPNITEAANNDTIFLATLGVLAGIGQLFAAALLLLANVFKLANMGSYLPFPVICGFFAAVGIMTWTLAISVDTGGMKIGTILTSGDPELMIFALVHHLPTVIVASIMKYVGPKNPLSVVFVILVTIALFHIIMLISGISLDQAKEMGWFWSHDELVYNSDLNVIGFEKWAPPAPFGMIHELFLGHVHWEAVSRGMNTTLALGFLYMIRCSVHGTALKKNIPNLVRKARHDDPLPTSDEAAIQSKTSIMPMKSRRNFSEAVDIEVVMQQPLSSTTTAGNSSADGGADEKLYHAKPSNIPLKAIMGAYAYSQVLVSLVGGFAITPSVAASPTMFMLGAEKVAPQVGSVILLVVFYLTDFELVEYIPKPACSSMLVLAFIDIIYTWFYKSYFRTQNKLEWMVVPLIVVCAFAVDLLSSVFLGIAFSTFIFVTSIFKSGVVKYVADGVVVRSTIERTFKNSVWLDKNGDMIRIMVLQNYLFFGNASSVYNFIGTEFFGSSSGVESDEDEEQQQHRKPKYLILDLSLVTGMDTTVPGIFSDIRNLCMSNSCKVFMSGMSQNTRSLLSLGGFKADTGVRSQRKLRFFPNLDTSVGKAEDMLLASDCEEKVVSETDPRRKRLLSEGGNGFRTALRHIDEEHGDGFSMDLLPLQEFTKLVEIMAGNNLYQDQQHTPLERGLFFIESGVLKIEQDTAATMTRGTFRGNSGGGDSYFSGQGDDSLTRIQARSLSRFSSLIIHDASHGNKSFRIARIGPGWIAGTMEAVCGVQPSGDYVAVTNCRLHHLPFSKLEEVEKKYPAVGLHLYKLLAYLMGRRQEATIGQLATLHSIMGSPANYKTAG